MSHVTYTADQIQRIKDDVNLTVVMEQLKKNIEEQLKNCGLYYRIFSRVKSAQSLADKLAGGDYDNEAEGKKVQDLIGIRVVLYYSDDLGPCRSIMMKAFTQNGSWSENAKTVNEFQASKINGVFEIPGKLVELVDDTIWKLPVDATFEVQLRTVLFEGWHEIEHDMRYKDVKNNKVNLWDDNESLARTMNSILASLELCDWSLSSLFENLSRNHLERGNWELMLRSRYRLRMSEKAIRPELKAYLDEHPMVARSFFICDKGQLVEALMDENVRTKLNSEVLLKVLNTTYVKDPVVEELLSDVKLRVYEPNITRNEVMPLENRVTFQLDVGLNDDNAAPEEILETFRMASKYIYNWSRYKYREVYPEMTEEVNTFKGASPGYSLKVDYDEERQSFRMEAVRIDTTMPGTIWFTETSVENKKGCLLFFCVITCSAPENEIGKINFRKPKFVDRIHEQTDFYDGFRIPKDLPVLENLEDRRMIGELISLPIRRLPVILVGWDGETDNYLIKADKLIATVGSFAHIYGNHMVDDGRVNIYWPDGSTQMIEREDILNSRFEYNRKVFTDEDIYEIPFRHHLVNLIRDRNNGIMREGGWL